MRIIAGAWRGRTIRTTRDLRVRPTADRAREAWMSILQHELPDARIVDLFAGSGALGLEALSRGAATCDFVEIASDALKAIRENVATLGAGERARIHRADVFKFLQAADHAGWDIALADPPYHQGFGARLANRWLERPFARILCVEHQVEEAMPDASDRRRWGSTGLSIYRSEEP
jgi:16S rRNA (guanine966-N2)-methyltransferase